MAHKSATNSLGQHGGKVDPEPAISCDVGSGFFPLGDTILTCTASDFSGNTTIASYTVTAVGITLPSMTSPADIVVEGNSTSGWAGEIGSAIVVDVVDPSPVVSNNAPALFGLGDTTVIWTATDASGNSTSTSQVVTVLDTTPPDLMVPEDISVECEAIGGTSSGAAAIQAFINGASSSDIVDESPSITSNAPTFCNLGTTQVVFTATDDSGNISIATANITVVDTNAPVIASLEASPDVLWPANGKMNSVVVTVDISDICDTNPSCKIIDVSSNEPINGKGDGNTIPDWEITGDLTLDLRSERSGEGTGRVYAITVECADASRNVSTGIVIVTVPHDQRKVKS